MAAYNLSPIYNAASIFGSNTSASSPNLPLAGGLLYTYAAGTSTLTATYTNSIGSIANTNPIVLGVDGRPPSEIWFPIGQAYKFVLQDSVGNTIATYDNLVGINDTTSGGVVGSDWIPTGLAPNYTGVTTFTTLGNNTATFLVGRRCKCTVTAGTVYGTIFSSVFGAVTTVTLIMDTGQNLDAGLSAVSVGILSTADGVPGILPYTLQANGFTTTGTNQAAIQIATGQFSGPGIGLTGMAASLTSGNATQAAGLSGSSPVLGTNWQVDGNGQLLNTSGSMYAGFIYPSAATTSGTLVLFNTVSQQGTNFSAAAGTVTIANAGTYLVRTNIYLRTGSLGTYNLYLGGSASHIYGFTSGAQENIYTGAAFTSVLDAIVVTTAPNQTLTVNYPGGFTGTILVDSGAASMSIVRIG